MTAVELGGPSWSWSLHLHGPTEFYNVHFTQLAAKVHHAEFVVCISDFSRSQVMAHTTTDQWPKLEKVRCGTEITTPLGRAASECVTVCSVGRLVPEKGQAVLLDALAAMPAAYRQRISCIFVGDGPSLDALNEQARRSGLADMVSFVGARSHAEALAIVENADIFCLPSFAEGVPIALMEAMVREVPVITTRVMGIPELVREGAGILVPPGSPTALATALQRLVDEPDLRRELGREGRAVVRSDFDVKETTQELHAVFQRRLAARQ